MNKCERHQWIVHTGSGRIYCRNCDAKLGPREVAERLYALEVLEAENKRLLDELDQLIAWHEGDDCPHARLEAVAYAAREHLETLPCVYYHYPGPGGDNTRCPRCATRKKLRAALAAAGYGEDE